MARLFQTRLKIEEQSIDIIPFDPKINQGSTTPIPSDPKIEQGLTTPILSSVKINQGESAILKTIEFNPNQGQIEISPVRPIRYDTADQLSLDLEKAKTDYFVLRQSNLLRQNLPTILPILSPGFTTVPGIVNKSFPSVISLEDRLNQSRVAGSTTGLPQFFLSDFYIGILPDIRYSFSPNQGSIVIQSLLFIPNQGSITITNFSFTPNQGTITITPYSFIPNQGDIIVSLFNFIPNQGTVTMNNVTTSFIGSLSFSFLPNQGSVTITPYGFIPNQDAQITVTNPISADQVLIGQGVTLDLAGNLVSIIVPQLITAIINQGSTTITIPEFTPEQGTTTLSQVEFIPDQGSTTPDTTSSINSILKAFLKPKEVHGEANLNILGYELDRLLARTLPEVKHGSTISILTNFATTFIPIQLVNNSISTIPTTSTSPSANFTPQFDTQDQTDLTDSPNTRYKEDRVTVNGLDALPQNNNTLENYLEIANTRAGLSGFYRQRQREIQQGNDNAGKSRSAQDNNIEQGYIKFSISSIRDGTTITFKPYLTAFSDNWAPTYTDVKYVGRQDIQKVFSSVTRTVSIGFKMAATNATNMKTMYSKIQSLIRASSVGKYSGNPYIIGPVLKVTVGDYITNAPCIATSLKVDTNPSEYSWRINSGYQGTDILDVSMELFMLADNNGATFNSNGTFVSI
jgi:hypothetical protein